MLSRAGRLELALPSGQVTGVIVHATRPHPRELLAKCTSSGPSHPKLWCVGMTASERESAVRLEGIDGYPWAVVLLTGSACLRGHGING